MFIQMNHLINVIYFALIRFLIIFAFNIGNKIIKTESYEFENPSGTDELP